MQSYTTSVKKSSWVNISGTMAKNSQNMKAPEMIPFATPGGKMVCANVVNGAWRDPNKIGGMTNRSLHRQIQPRIVEMSSY